MDKYNVMLTDKAANDINEIYKYSSNELYDENAAERLLEKFETNTNSLGKMPKRNPLLQDEGLAQQGIRRLMVDNYILFYLCDHKNKKVIVIRVLYNKRNWIDLV